MLQFNYIQEIHDDIKIKLYVKECELILEISIVYIKNHLILSVYFHGDT